MTAGSEALVEDQAQLPSASPSASKQGDLTVPTSEAQEALSERGLFALDVAKIGGIIK